LLTSRPIRRGTLHIIVNNLIGSRHAPPGALFALPLRASPAPKCSHLPRQREDPMPSCALPARRRIPRRFNSDVVIDLIGYRATATAKWTIHHHPAAPLCTHQKPSAALENLREHTGINAESIAVAVKKEFEEEQRSRQAHQDSPASQAARLLVTVQLRQIQSCL